MPLKQKTHRKWVQKPVNSDSQRQENYISGPSSVVKTYIQTARMWIAFLHPNKTKSYKTAYPFKSELTKFSCHTSLCISSPSMRLEIYRALSFFLNKIYINICTIQRQKTLVQISPGFGFTVDVSLSCFDFDIYYKTHVKIH